MSLRLTINGVCKGTLQRENGVGFIIVNWIVGQESQDIFIAAAAESRFQSLTPTDCIEIDVQPDDDDVATDVEFDGSMGTRPTPLMHRFGFDVAVNDGAVSSVRTSFQPDVATALVFVDDHKSQASLAIRAGDTEVFRHVLTVGDRVRVQLATEAPVVAAHGGDA